MSSSKKNTKTKDSFIKKYGTYLIIGALLVIFVIVAVATKDSSTSSNNNEETVFVSMGVSEWQEAVKSDTLMVTTLAQTTCSWCNEFKPVMQKVAGENDLEIVWIDIDTIA